MELSFTEMESPRGGLDFKEKRGIPVSDMLT